MLNKIAILMLTILALIIQSCGEATVSVTNISYEPKLSIEGFLIAERAPEKIRINRNFPVNAQLRNMSLIPENMLATITDVASGTVYDLTFHPSSTNTDSNWFDYTGGDFIVEPGKNYRLDVSGEVSGKVLNASAETTVPLSGFEITAMNFDQLTYRQPGENGEVSRFFMTINRSPGTTFYLNTIHALDADLSTFVYNNPFFNIDRKDIEENMHRLSFQMRWIQDTPDSAGETEIEIFWSDLWFYSQYELVVFAADNNYKDFIQTFGRVRETDGNFHEAKFNIEGDGIGVFGSMIADTAYISVTEN